MRGPRPAANDVLATILKRRAGQRLDICMSASLRAAGFHTGRLLAAQRHHGRRMNKGPKELVAGECGEGIGATEFLRGGVPAVTATQARLKQCNSDFIVQEVGCGFIVLCC